MVYPLCTLFTPRNSWSWRRLLQIRRRYELYNNISLNQCLTVTNFWYCLNEISYFARRQGL